MFGAVKAGEAAKQGQFDLNRSANLSMSRGARPTLFAYQVGENPQGVIDALRVMKHFGNVRI